MSVTSQQGVFAFAPQSGKGQYVTSASSFMRTKVTEMDLGLNQDGRVFPGEIGGVLVPTGAYKGMAFYGGGFTFNPRIDGGALGYLAKGALGVANTGASQPLDGIRSQCAITDAAAGMTKDKYGDPRKLLAAGETVTVSTCPVPTNSKRVVLVVISRQSGALAGNLTVADDSTHTETFALSGVTGPGVYFMRGTQNMSGNIASFTTPAASGAWTEGNVYFKLGFIYDSTESVNEHVFRFNPDDHTDIPWHTFRAVIPGKTSSEWLGVEGRDVRITQFGITVPQNGIVTARVDALGRIPRTVKNPYNNAGENWDDGWRAFDSYTSVPVSSVLEGGIYIPGWTAEEAKLTAFGFTVANNLTTPQQEMVIGSYYPDDFTPLSRAVSIRATVKWNNPDLYLQIANGDVDSTDWSSIVFTSPVYAMLASPNPLSSSNPTPANMRFYAQNVMLQAAQPPTMAAGELVQMQLTGTVLEPASGDYVDVRLTNNEAAYA